MHGPTNPKGKSGIKNLVFLMCELYRRNRLAAGIG